MSRQDDEEHDALVRLARAPRNLLSEDGKVLQDLAIRVLARDMLEALDE